MSHFTVMVIGENPEKQLAPFQENNMGNCPKKYLKYRVWGEDGKDHWFDSIKAFKASGIKPEDEDGGYWENPNKKWDWYVLGGRWTGFFKMKTEAACVVGEAGLMAAPADPGYGDQSIKADIDFEGMRKEAEDRAAKQYDYVTSFLSGLPLGKKWDEVRAEYKDTDKAREAYWSQPRNKAWETEKKKVGHKDWPLGFFSSPDEFACTREEYLEAARNSAFVPFAVLKDGVWYEKGQMGWWACVSNKKDEAVWNEEVNKLVDGLPENTLISVYDCHI